MKRIFTKTFKVSNYERHLLDQLCHQDGRSLSEWMRELIRMEAARRGIDIQQTINTPEILVIDGTVIDEQ